MLEATPCISIFFANMFFHLPLCLGFQPQNQDYRWLGGKWQQGPWERKVMGEVALGTGRAPAVLWFYFTFLCFPFFSAGERARLNEAGVLLLRFF